jgi:Protein of unknown function (DUF4236)
MGFRFRKRLRLFPGAWINLSKSGASLSVGGHGLTANIGKGGVQETMGLPGSGLTYRTKRRPIGTSHRAAARRAIPMSPRRGFWSWLLGD